jgi:hypothetical protein
MTPLGRFLPKDEGDQREDLLGLSDARAAAWGRPLAEPAPAIRGIGIAADVFAPRQEISAGVDAAAFGGSTLRTEWEVLAEATDLRVGGDEEAAPARIPVDIVHADAATVRFLAPAQPGAYRLFITIRDRQAKATHRQYPVSGALTCAAGQTLRRLPAPPQSF